MEYLTDKDYEIAAANGIDRITAYNRVYYQNWSIEKAITKPKRSKDPFKEKLEKEYPNWQEILRANGLTYYALYQRYKNGMSIKEALFKPRFTEAEKAKKRSATLNSRIKPEHYAIAEANGIKKGTVKARVYQYKWSIEKAITEPIQQPNWQVARANVILNKKK